MHLNMLPMTTRRGHSRGLKITTKEPMNGKPPREGTGSRVTLGKAQKEQYQP